MNITPPPSPPRLQSPPHEDDDMPDLEDISEEEEAEEAEAEAPRTPENQRITSSAEPPDAPLRLRLRLRRPPPNITDLETPMLVLSADERMEPCAGFLLLLGGLTVIAYAASAAVVYMGSFWFVCLSVCLSNQKNQQKFFVSFLIF
jgi:hypothetical protein